MCGIVGYTGPREAYPIIIKGLKRLEYRGYDSTGVALQNSTGVKVYKKKGKVAELEDAIVGKDLHAFASLLEVARLKPERFSKKVFHQLLRDAISTKEWMTKNIYESRAKDYQNEFRKMVYDNEKEMEKVIGKLKDNAFINQQQEELKQFKKQVLGIIKSFGL